MKDFNTIKARHFRYSETRVSFSHKEYYWHIPKALREKDFVRGDIALVNARDKNKRVIISEVLREEIEETGKKYKSVKNKLEPIQRIADALDHFENHELEEIKARRAAAKAEAVAEA